MSSINKNVNVERRTWDKETYEARARSRAQATESSDVNPPTTAEDETAEEETPEEFLKASSDRAGPMGSKRAFLKSRSNRVDLTSKLGSVEIIDPKAAANVGGGATMKGNGVTKCSDGVGWHCRVCDCFLKDSLTYLDHINGRKHQRYLGYSMRTEKSTAEEVGSVLKGLAEKKNAGDDVVEVVDFEEVVKAREEEALRRKQERARRREERKKRARGEVVDGEGEQGADITGDENPADQNPAEEADDNDEHAEGEEEDEEKGDGIDPNLAAMMGFSGFGGSRKS